MISNENVHRVLVDFAESVISSSRDKLQSKNSTGDLSESLDYKLKVSKNSFDLDLLMAEYGKFVDKGVSGTINKYNTPYSFKSKGGKRGLKGMPPPKAFDKWNIIKGRAFRDEKGRFLKRKQLNFATAVGVFKYGIKPSRFFTTSFDDAFNLLPKELVDAYGLDIKQFMDFTLNNE